MTYIIYDLTTNQAVTEVSDQIPAKGDLICAFGEIYKVSEVVWRPTHKYMSSWVGSVTQGIVITAFVWIDKL